MVCVKPLKGYVDGSTGGFTFSPKRALKIKGGLAHLTVNCRKCVGCLRRRSFDYAIRSVHESRLHKKNLFVTLTYSDSNLPDNNGLKRSHIQDFVKNFREVCRREYNHVGIRIFYCGEYGTKSTMRPHYHIILFNVPPNLDLRPVLSFKRSSRTCYRSKIIFNCWKKGIINIQDCTPATCSYVAQYVSKKNKFNSSFEKGREPEFIQGSTRPGLGYSWLFEHNEGYNALRLFETCKVPFYSSDGTPIYVYPPRYYIDKFCEIFSNFRNAFKNALLSSVLPYIDFPVDKLEQRLYNYEQKLLEKLKEDRRNLCL